MLRDDLGRLALTASLCVPINQTFFLNGVRLAYADLTRGADLRVLPARGPAPGHGAGAGAAGAGSAGRNPCERLGRGGDRPGGPLARGIGGPGSAPGDLLLVAAVGSWGAYLTVSKPLIARHGALPALAGTFLLGSLLDLPIALATCPSWPALTRASPVAWRAGVPDPGGDGPGPGLPEPGPPPPRRQPGRHVRQRGPRAHGRLGVWLFDEPISPPLVLGGILTLGGILWTGRLIRRSPANASA